MVIVLNGADFSKSNLGQINVNLALTSDVKEILANLTRFPAIKENGYAQALNRLYSSLKEEGILEKMKVLCIPYMATSYDECSYNIATMTYTKNALGLLYSLNENNELVQSNTISGTTIGYDIALESNNCCLFGISKGNGEYGFLASAGIMTNYYIGKNTIRDNSEVMGQVVEGGANVTSSNGGALLSRAIADGAYVVNYNNGITSFIDSKGEFRGSSSVPAMSLTKYLPLAASGGGPATAKSTGLFGCCEALTEKQLDSLFRILAEFNENFG